MNAINREYIYGLTHGQVYNLSGDANKDNRQAVMQLLTGVKMPKAKCGVNAIMSALMEVSGINGKGECLRHREIMLAEWLKTGQYTLYAGGE